MIDYSLQDSGVFKVNFSGTVSVEDVKNYLIKFEKIDYLKTHILLLYDLRDAKMNINLKELISISKATKKATASYNRIRTVFLVNQPNLTAYSILFTRESPSRKTVRKVFSTENAALEWLLSTD